MLLYVTHFAHVSRTTHRTLSQHTDSWSTCSSEFLEQGVSSNTTSKTLFQSVVSKHAFELVSNKLFGLRFQQTFLLAANVGLLSHVTFPQKSHVSKLGFSFTRFSLSNKPNGCSSSSSLLTLDHNWMPVLEHRAKRKHWGRTLSRVVMAPVGCW